MRLPDGMLQTRWWQLVAALSITATVLACTSDPPAPPAARPQLRTAPTPDPIGCTWQPPATQGFVNSASLQEISGLAASRRHAGHLWVHNDSGAKAELYLLSASGQPRLSIHLDGAPHTDWEDLALGPCPPQLEPAPGQPPADCLWVADIGDNAENRGKVEVLAVAEPAILPALSQATPQLVAPKGSWRAVEVNYPDGPHNAEALALLPGGWALILTKRDDGKAALYRAAVLQAMADKDGKIKAESLGLLDLSAAGVSSGERLRATAADFDPARSRLVVRTYASIQLFDGAQMLVAASAPEVAAQVANWHGLLLPSPAEAQGEALAFQGSKRWVAVGEGPLAKIYAGECTGP